MKEAREVDKLFTILSVYVTCLSVATKTKEIVCTSFQQIEGTQN